MLWLAPEEAGYLLSVGDKRGGWVAQEHSGACLPRVWDTFLICFVDSIKWIHFCIDIVSSIVA